MPQRERLAAALRNAHAAGDEDAARRLASAIRQMESQGGETAPADMRGIEAGTPVPAAQGTQSGMFAQQDQALIEQIAEASDAGDEARARRLTAQLSGRVAARTDDDTTRGVTGRAEAAARGWGSAMFGLGDVVAGGTSYLRDRIGNLGNPEAGEFDFGDHMAFARGRREAVQGIAPVTNVAGMVPGIVSGVGAVRGASAGLTAIAPQVAQRAGQIFGFQRGQTGLNLVRSAAGGGAAAGVTAGIESGGDVEDTLGAAGIGAVAGPVAERVIGTGIRGAQAVSRRLNPEAAATAALAHRTGMDGGQLRQRLAQFQQRTGQQGAVADVLDERAAVELAPAASAGQDATVELLEGVARRNAARPGRMSEALRQQGDVGSPTALTRARDAEADDIMGVIGGDTITVPAAPALLGRPAVLNSLNQLADAAPAAEAAELRRIVQAMRDAPDDAAVPLSLRQVDSLRRALSASGEANPAMRYELGRVANELDQVARAQNPDYARFLDEYAASSQLIDGVSAGSRVLNRGGTTEFVEAGRGATPAGRTGIAMGARTRLSDEALESPQAAATLARRMDEDPGLQERLGFALPRPEAETAAALARTEARSANALQGLSRGAIQRSIDPNEQRAVQSIVDAGVIATGRFSGSFIANTALRLARLAGGSDQRAVALARALTADDPATVQRAVQRLESLGATQQDILTFRQVFGASAAAQAVSGDTRAPREEAFREQE